MDIKIIAAVLLTLRLMSVAFLYLVLKRQVRYLRSKKEPELQNVRILLTSLTAIILLGQLVPILIDSVTLLDVVERSMSRPHPIGIAYALSNGTTAVVTSYLLYKLYKTIEGHRDSSRKR